LVLNKRFIALMVCFLFTIQLLLPAVKTEAASLSVNQIFAQNVAKELNTYIKKSGGKVTLHYRDLTTGEEFSIQGDRAGKAASTIKLPLAMYVMELASQNKLNLNEKLTYKSHHYYGGSGVIQNQRVGTKYTIRDLVKKAMVHSDNIAFIMLRERVGKSNFIAYMKKLGGKYAYPNGQNLTSSKDLVVYASYLYNFAQNNHLGKELVGYLKATDYNTTIPKGIKGSETAHKVGMIPMSLIYNDVGIVYDETPFALAVMTNNISYVKSQQVIADIAAIIHKHHKAKNKVAYFKTVKATPLYKNTKGTQVIANLSKDESFEITSKTESWYEIKIGKNIGYVQKKAVVAYPGSSNGFANINLEFKGLAKVLNSARVLSKTSASGKTIAILQKGELVDFEKMVGDYYQTVIGDRYGYVHKNEVQLEYTSSVKLIEITQDQAPLLIPQNGKYIQIGNVQKGGQYPRIREQGDYNVVQIGTMIAFVAKKAAAPLYSASITNLGSQKATGILVLEQDEIIYNSTNTATQEAVGKLTKGQKITYVQQQGDWYEINFLGRQAYIPIRGGPIR
jgi:hypothetical protein